MIYWSLPFVWLTGCVAILWRLTEIADVNGEYRAVVMYTAAGVMMGMAAGDSIWTRWKELRQ